jgi:signal transduction histidine kinase
MGEDEARVNTASDPACYHLPDASRQSSRASSPPSDENLAEVQQWNRALLRQNAIWFCRLRWIVVAALCGTGILGLFPRHTQILSLAIPPVLPLSAAGILALLNGIFVRLISLADHPRGAWTAKGLLWLQISCDLLVLTGVVHWMGRDLPSASFMYLFHIILACIVFTPLESLLVLALAAAFYLASVILAAQGFLTPMSVFAAQVSGESTQPTGGIWLAYRVGFTFLVWAVIWYLVSWLAGKLQVHEHQLALTNFQLKASGEERSAPMLQTTHQLTAPFASIHAQTQLLLGNYCGVLPDKARQVVETIASRSMALSRQIQQMLQLANLRSQGQSDPPRKDLDLAQLATAAVARAEPAARQRNITLQSELEPAPVNAVEDYLTMLLDNLIVNAVNYSHDHGTVEIRCHLQEKNQVVLTVQDHGIGIPAEKLPRIFDDYYSTEEAVKHNRTSSGLGLAVVRQVAHATPAAVQVESAPGWGTRFTVTVPRRSPTPQPSATRGKN